MQIGMYCTAGWFAQTIVLSKGFAASKVAFAASLSVLFVPLLELLFGSKKQKQVNENSRKGSGIMSLLPAFLAIAGVGFLELSGVEGIFS